MNFHCSHIKLVLKPILFQQTSFFIVIGSRYCGLHLSHSTTRRCFNLYYIIIAIIVVNRTANFWIISFRFSFTGKKVFDLSLILNLFWMSFTFCMLWRAFFPIFPSSNTTLQSLQKACVSSDDLPIRDAKALLVSLDKRNCVT